MRQIIALAAVALATTVVPIRGSADTIYVSSSAGTLTKFTLAGVGTPFGDFTVHGSPAGLDLDSTGNLYAANTTSTFVFKYTPAGVGSLFASVGANGSAGLAFDNAGYLYVANALTNTIQKITPGGVASVFVNSGLNTPVGLAVDSADNLYVANKGSNTIQRFTPGGVGSIFANTGLDNPTGLAFDSAGNLFAANFGNSTIERFTPVGSGSLFASTGLASPVGLAFDSAGNLYATNFDGHIQKFTPGGAGSLFANMGPNTLSYITVQVPEPGSVSLAALALGGLVACVRLGQNARSHPIGASIARRIGSEAATIRASSRSNASDCASLFW